MPLPLLPPLAPQLARSATEMPAGPGWSYERKLDGFRAIAFVDGEELTLQSRGGRPLARYFPELRFPSGRYVLDGEVVVRGAGAREDFEALQQRVHPAASRIARLSVETPATFVAFDLLAFGDEILTGRPLAERRALMEERLGDLARTESTADRAAASGWLTTAEGVVAKPLDGPYRPGERADWVKIKRVRTLDCVVVGWRPGKDPETVGALILGLYDAGGKLRVIGHSSGFTAARKRELRDVLGPLETGARGAGEASRWTAGRELEWVELRPELVAEVTADHVAGGRIRHGARFVRFRTDRDARDCGIAQLEG